MAHTAWYTAEPVLQSRACPEQSAAARPLPEACGEPSTPRFLGRVHMSKSQGLACPAHARLPPLPPCAAGGQVPGMMTTQGGLGLSPLHFWRGPTCTPASSWRAKTPEAGPVCRETMAGRGRCTRLAPSGTVGT